MKPEGNGSMTLFDRLLADRGSELQDRPAVQCGEAVWTYAEAHRLVISAARKLQALGLQHGDRVLMVQPNSPEYLASFFGITALGAVAVPIDYNSGPERIAFIIEDTQPKFCLHGADRTFGDDLPIPHHAVVVPPGSTRFELTPATPVEETETPLPAVKGDAAAVILYSAGSTGRQKGAVLKHAQLLTIARTLVDIIEMDRDHRDLIVSPMTHSGGWQRVTSTLMAGGCAVIPELGFTVAGLLDEIHEREIRGFFAAPPVLRMLMMNREERVRQATGSLRSIESASAPLSPAELQRLLDLMPNIEVYFQYGLTECSRAFILDARAHQDKLHTVGLATPGVDVAIADAEDRRLGPNTKGEILLSAFQLTDHYWNRPDLDEERFRGRWLRTGDIGSLDEQGFLTYHGRMDDMINCGGLSFFPAEVENELGPIEGLSAYLIAGVPDPQGILGHVPWAFVVPADPGSWKAKMLVQQAKQRLPPHMIPRRVVTMPSLPQTASGKPSRRRVLELYGPASEEEASDG